MKTIFYKPKITVAFTVSNRLVFPYYTNYNNYGKMHGISIIVRFLMFEIRFRKNGQPDE